ncbi:hypothetical protein RSal33209_2566 [Renibacterium salmoninarum ATCC 33209]|uniref:Uncharacterized protein n=1 Tax=Renibacterium salmoninarum (strain ATCC 33209 / DSM 20767 / JCM 11484 / NBRC 15589 / NCIMB 2235) TaxID=288705 RepID=A9WRL0_RENSM|nr:hypothetical protein [Renibacterium salmoninarum]ABY24292.1 hypothetical protein RSal33209_2566 [Renibacterium salmoninarum ATCC 33209]
MVDEQQVKQGRDDVSLKTYADGSKSKTVFQTPVASTPGSVQPRSIGECRDQDGVGVFPFTACKITSQVSAYMIEFYADGRKRSNGSNQAFAASIDRVYGGSYVGAGNPGEGRGEIFEQYQVGDNPARARWSFTVSGGVAGTTLSVTFYVRNGDRWDTNP